MAITLVSGQVAQGSIGSGSALTIVLPNAPTTGNLVVAEVVYGGTTATITCVDNNGNAYTPTPNSPVTLPQGARGAIFYLKDAPSNASATITFTQSVVGSDMAGHAAEFAGANKTAPFDVEASHISATSQTNINDPTLTPSGDNSLLFGMVSSSGGLTTVNSPWTALGTVVLGNWAEYLVQTTKQAQAISFTQSGASIWIAMEAAFKIAGQSVVVNATSTTTTTVTKRVTRAISATATSTSNVIRRALKALLATATSSTFVQATQAFIGSTSKVINATCTSSSTTVKRVFTAINAIVSTLTFSGKQFNVIINAIVNTLDLLISSTHKTIFTFGKNILQALDQNIFETRRTIFAYQETEPEASPSDLSGTFICNVDGAAGIWSGASGSFNLDFEE